jgi:hypothetical protein
MYARCPLLFLGCQLLAPVPVVIDDGVLVDGYYTDATLEVTVLSVESLRQTPSYSLLLRLLRHRVVGRVGLLLQHGSGASGTGDDTVQCRVPRGPRRHPKRYMTPRDKV